MRLIIISKQVEWQEIVLILVVSQYCHAEISPELWRSTQKSEVPGSIPGIPT